MLDNDELRATRKLHGQDDGLYKESDKDVARKEKRRMLKENEYIRTDLGNILKYTRKEKEFIDEHLSISNKKDIEFLGTIVKHSKDITDLIEAGDVIEVRFPVRNTIRKIYVDEYFGNSMILNGITSGNVILKTILTKEQYMKNCYKIDTNQQT